MSRLALLLIPALLGAQPDPNELLRQSADAIKQFRSYEMDSAITVRVHGGSIDNDVDMLSTISVRHPDRMRIESGSTAGSVSIVSDGEHTWYHLLPLNKYIQRPAVALPESVSSAGMGPKNLPDISKSIQSVKLKGEEILNVGGEKIPCWLIETTYGKIAIPEQELTVNQAVQQTWISKAHKLNLQSTFEAKITMPGEPEPVEMEQSTRTTALRLNVDLPDSQFVFKPSADSTETEDWTLPGIVKPDVIGKSAAALKIPATPGKVALLYFTAPWCAPCQREQQMVEKIGGEFQNSGLMVLPADASSTLPEALSITSLPTAVLIDRTGKIVSYEAGARGEAALRADLAKAGIAKPAAR